MPGLVEYMTMIVIYLAFFWLGDMLLTGFRAGFVVAIAATITYELSTLFFGKAGKNEQRKR